MGISKKKIQKQIKGTTEEYHDTLEKIVKAKNEEENKLTAKSDRDLFTTNVQKQGLKQQREKLKADRFQAKLNASTSKSDDRLIKRYAKSIEKRVEQGLEAIPQKEKVTSNPLKQKDLNDLKDIWATPAEVKSKQFNEWK